VNRPVGKIRDMARFVVSGIAVLLLVWAPPTKALGDDPAKVSAKTQEVAAPTQGAQDAPAKATTIPRSPDFKVVFWYQNGLLKHQVYDVRKGQYTKAVDNWVHRVHYDPSGLYALPGPMAFVRDVFLEEEPGETESEKLANAIARIEERVSGRDRRALRDRAYIRGYAGPVPGYTVPMERERKFRPLPLSSTPSAPGSGGFSLAPGPASPFPYPYVRPHP
jgi:hypothetical protein